MAKRNLLGSPDNNHVKIHCVSFRYNSTIHEIFMQKIFVAASMLKTLGSLVHFQVNSVFIAKQLFIFVFDE